MINSNWYIIFIRLMTSRMIRNSWLLMACLVLSACEKVVLESEEDDTQEQTGNVTLSVAGFEELKGWARGTTDLMEVCTRLTFVVYQNDEKVKAVNQKADDSDFGKVSMTLDEGDYQVLVLGHSCAGKDNPSVKNATKIQFTNHTESGSGTGYSDTFYYYGDLTVGAKQTSKAYTLKRAVAMFRLVTTDVKPANIKKVWFYYTGGSGALDATTGYGCVNSKQAVFFFPDEETDGQTMQFELYTFLHEEEGEIDIQVRGFDAVNDGNVVFERAFKGVPMQRNTITQYSGALFSTGNEKPEDPDNPDNPDNPDDPENPDNPENPENPDDPTPSTGTFQVEADWAATNYFTF